MTDYLFRKSVEILKKNQAPSGAFPASPNFATYRYSWLRDGTFIAYALDLAGEQQAARQFYHWACLTVLRYRGKIERVLEKKGKGINISEDEYLHTRYTLSGEEGQDPWGNFQLDGYGTLLWGVAQHLALHGALHIPAEWKEALSLVAQYLKELWLTPCLDCWEESNHIHPSTLAAIYGGLDAIGTHLEIEADAELGRIRELAINNYVMDGYFVKFKGLPTIDANLLWLAVPYNLLPPAHPLMVRTVQEIESQLVNGGVHRYQGDNYYGGGQWIILTAWLAWYYISVGLISRAKELEDWIRQQADGYGELPEQVPACLQVPECYNPWVERWGAIAKPLLWSQAMYVIVTQQLGSMVGR
ncbi:MAG: glycoside hydrolase family 15 protein [Bacillota bacterium]